MKNFLVCIIMLHLLCSYVAVGQEKEDNVGFNQYSSSLFNSKENTLNVVSALDPATDNNVKSDIAAGILIQQIGDYNRFLGQIKSEDANISVLQNGSDNEVFLEKEAAFIRQRIIQEGKGNFLTDVSRFTTEDINMELIQQGDNQTLQSYGTNSISNDMTVRQSGNGASVIIINK